MKNIKELNVILQLLGGLDIKYNAESCLDFTKRKQYNKEDDYIETIYSIDILKDIEHIIIDITESRDDVRISTKSNLKDLDITPEFDALVEEVYGGWKLVEEKDL